MRDDLLAIWRAGVDGVCTDRLICNNVRLLLPEDVRNIDRRDYSIEVGGVGGCEQYSFSGIDRIIVVGGGKASGAMAESLLRVLSPVAGKVEISGWVNVPNDCAKSLGKIHLHAARPSGVNEPTLEAVYGTGEIMRIVGSLTRFDLCICLISGGGSALLPAPVVGISLVDKCELVRFLGAAGATIREINTVRKVISRIKGGGLKRLCRGKRLISLILSDVLGDPLDVIASGVTVDSASTAIDALNVLKKFLCNGQNVLSQNESLKRVFDYVEFRAKSMQSELGGNNSSLQIDRATSKNMSKNMSNNTSNNTSKNASNNSASNISDESNKFHVELLGDSLGEFSGGLKNNLADNLTNDLSNNLPDKLFDVDGGFVRNIIIGNNALAVEAAGLEALRRGYRQTMFSAVVLEGFAEDVGYELVRLGLGMFGADVDCLVHGGEPVVKLVAQELRGDGGRNQQLILAAACKLLSMYGDGQIPLAMLAGSTDGEDGPTDAAGAWIDPVVWKVMNEKIKQDENFNPEHFLKRNDAYNFFKQLNTLIKTGITGTNVCDLRIVIRRP
ncbi:MAG: DUF4147 domain-containing protein [Planctomycetaceae bacterium]|nr:DUF4147 domain-containing protein [Planctomycetaceae bacterium]